MPGENRRAGDAHTFGCGEMHSTAQNFRPGSPAKPAPAQKD
jgi:hypothetical protein